LSNALKISEAASLAMHAMSYLAIHGGGGPVTTRAISEHFKASEAHLSKVMQRLAREGLVKSHRGPGGGILLAKDPAEITLLDIYEAIEGQLSGSPCLFGQPSCGYPDCILGDLTGNVNKTIDARLRGTTLSALAKNLGGSSHEKKTKNN
jgi:Rrf2 family protein